MRAMNLDDGIVNERSVYTGRGTGATRQMWQKCEQDSERERCKIQGHQQTAWR
jgi:hypothetical protein